MCNISGFIFFNFQVSLLLCSYFTSQIRIPNTITAKKESLYICVCVRVRAHIYAQCTLRIDEVD